MAFFSPNIYLHAEAVPRTANKQISIKKKQRLKLKQKRFKKHHPKKIKDDRKTFRALYWIILSVWLGGGLILLITGIVLGIPALWITGVVLLSLLLLLVILAFIFLILILTGAWN